MTIAKDKYLLGTVYIAHCPFHFKNESRWSNTNISNQKQGKRPIQRASTKRERRRSQTEILIKTEREGEKKEITKRKRDIMVCIFVRDTPSRFLPQVLLIITHTRLTTRASTFLLWITDYTIKWLVICIFIKKRKARPAYHKNFFPYTCTSIPERSSTSTTYSRPPLILLLFHVYLCVI